VEIKGCDMVRAQGLLIKDKLLIEVIDAFQSTTKIQNRIIQHDDVLFGNIWSNIITI
jgi:hypothetical protein